MNRIAVLTSGGDAQGMNAAVRAIVRTALSHQLEVFAIREGYQGLIDGGKRIVKADWDFVGGILQKGGTILGSARSAEMRTFEGRLKAAKNLLINGIDKLVIVGGDGSLTGAHIFRQEWSKLLATLLERGEITAEIAEKHPHLYIIGLIGSIDNDMFGTDMTIGADSALVRITDAIDAIGSTATSHQRTFVVEVMGRACGYLALMSALATGADWVLVPESPPDTDDWEGKMCKLLKRGREAGRRDSIVVVAEGAIDRNGNPISVTYVKEVLEKNLGEDVRLTVLGHVQRGGSPSAFDRVMATRLGYAAVNEIIKLKPEDKSIVVGVHDNKVILTPLMESVRRTKAVAEAIKNKNYELALKIRGGSFKEAWNNFHTMVRSMPHAPAPGQKRLRLAVMHAGAPAPGMNTAVRAAVRIGLDKGHIMIGIQNGFVGLIEGKIEEFGWMSVNGWSSSGGSELGTNRKIPHGSDLYAIARNFEKFQIDGLLIIGGWTAYESAYIISNERNNFPAFKIPIVCLPASINNNLPGADLSIGADTALNNIAVAVDKIKQSGYASRRCLVVELMGRYCGYLTLMAGLAAGAERVYLHEEGITLKDLQQDLDNLIKGFKTGKRLGLLMRSERANKTYTTHFVSRLFEEEAHGAFEVKQAILGHLQQGGNPSPFDRIQATRYATTCINFLITEAESKIPQATFMGIENAKFRFYDLRDLPRLTEWEFQRPLEQWWMNLRPIARIMAQNKP